MQYYISQAGAIEGPHSLEVVQSMLLDGRLTPADLGAIPGDSDWKPLSELIDCSGTENPASSAPPPLPPEPPRPSLDAPFMFDGVIPSGTHGKTARQIVEEVAAGGRFVIYQYVFSIILLSFRRSSPITYIPPGRSGVGPAFGWSFLSMTLGWWGFPWGIIYTIGALWRNAAGGVDVTEPILASWIGPQHADAMIRTRPKRPSGGLWLLRGLIASPLVLIALLIFLSAKGASEQKQEEAKLPGYAEFKRADDFVNRSKTEGGGGNTTTATVAAGAYREMLQTLRDEAIANDSSSSSKKQNTRISVWCEAHDNRCLFLVKVPDLRHFTDEAKDYICDAAWFSAQVCANHMDLPNDTELAVAVRGLALYDRMVTGKIIADLDTESDDLESTLKASIRKTDRQLTRKNRLAQYFVPPSR
jgi:hypothetical protein